MAINNDKSTTYADSVSDISGILSTVDNHPPFFPQTQINLLKKGAVMFVLAAIACGGSRSEQFHVNPVNSQPESLPLATSTVDSSQLKPPVAKALPHSALEFILGPKSARSVELYAASPSEIFDRIQARLIQCEAHETDLHLKQDYRQAFICLSLARKGNTDPFLVSSYTVYGLHPDKVWPKIMANRRERLGHEFGQWWTPEGVLLPDVEVPKKPSLTGDAATGDGTSSELPGSTSPASLPMKGRTA